MIDSINPYYTNTSTGQTSTSPASPANPMASFQEMLSSLLMSSGMSSGGLEGGMGSSNMLAPLMMMLVEQLLDLQTNEQKPVTQPYTLPTAYTNSAYSMAAYSNSAMANIQYNGANPIPFGRPVGGVLTQQFHASHNGLDFGIPVGTPVVSTMDGQVIYAGWNDQGYGNLVIVDNGAYRTYYAHLSEIPVQVGQMVNAGSVIGLSGNTGNSTGPHLHYEIRVNGKAIDPTTATLG